MGYFNGYYDGYWIEDFQDFDYYDAAPYAGEGEEIIAYGETEDWCHWAIAWDGYAYKAYLHKPTYVMGYQEFDDPEWYFDNPLWIEEFDDQDSAFSFVNENIGLNW